MLPYAMPPIKGFFSMFERSSPNLEKDVCDDVDPPSFDEEVMSPIKNQELWFFPKYDDEPTSCFPNNQNSIILNMSESFTPSYPKDYSPKIILHHRFIYWVTDIS